GGPRQDHRRERRIRVSTFFRAANHRSQEQGGGARSSLLAALSKPRRHGGQRRGCAKVVSRAESTSSRNARRVDQNRARALRCHPVSGRNAGQNLTSPSTAALPGVPSKINTASRLASSWIRAKSTSFSKPSSTAPNRACQKVCRRVWIT